MSKKVNRIVRVKKDREWKVSENHPKITPELRALLNQAFNRLATLNVRSMSTKLTKPEQLEQHILARLHNNFRFGIGEWSTFIGKKYFDRKYTPKA